MSARLERLAAAVARHAKGARASLVARDRAIVRMHEAGASLRDVGAAAGLTHTAVAKIVKRKDGTP